MVLEELSSRASRAMVREMLAFKASSIALLADAAGVNEVPIFADVAAEVVGDRVVIAPADRAFARLLDTGVTTLIARLALLLGVVIVITVRAVVPALVPQ